MSTPSPATSAKVEPVSAVAATPFSYEAFTQRNNGYVEGDIQSRIRSTRLMIAGCGLGSSTAICAARIGFENFVLIDGDTIDAHNLNRQFFDFADLGSLKVDALAKQILRINPEAKIVRVRENLDAKNVVDVVTQADVVFDTIDFVDIDAICALHNTVAAQKKPLFTALGIGYGAGVMYFAPDAPQHSLPAILADDMKAAAAIEGSVTYAAVFARLMGRIGQHLDAQVMREVNKALTIMENGRPCPASQIGVGSFACGALAVSMMHDMLAGLDVPKAPRITVHSFRNHCTKMIDMRTGRAVDIEGRVLTPTLHIPAVAAQGEAPAETTAVETMQADAAPISEAAVTVVV